MLHVSIGLCKMLTLFPRTALENKENTNLNPLNSSIHHPSLKQMKKMMLKYESYNAIIPT